MTQEIGKEENLEYREHDEKLDEDNGPQRPPESHGTETIAVKPPYPAQRADASATNGAFSFDKGGRFNGHLRITLPFRKVGLQPMLVL